MEEKFLAAYNDHGDALFRYCLFKVGDRDIAKDLVQDIFTKTWVYMSDGSEIKSFKSFLYRTLNNTIVDYYRKKKSYSLETLTEEGFDQAYEEAVSGEDKIDSEKAMELLSRLPEDYRDVLFMKYVEDLSISEIAEVTGELENTVSVRIHRGLKKLKEVLPEDI